MGVVIVGAMLVVVIATVAGFMGNTWFNGFIIFVVVVGFVGGEWFMGDGA